jgi:hypothetical protein
MAVIFGKHLSSVYGEIAWSRGLRDERKPTGKPDSGV